MWFDDRELGQLWHPKGDDVTAAVSISHLRLDQGSCRTGTKKKTKRKRGESKVMFGEAGWSYQYCHLKIMDLCSCPKAGSVLIRTCSLLSESNIKCQASPQTGEYSKTEKHSRSASVLKYSHPPAQQIRESYHLSRLIKTRGIRVPFPWEKKEGGREPLIGPESGIIIDIDLALGCCRKKPVPGLCSISRATLRCGWSDLSGGGVQRFSPYRGGMIYRYLTYQTVETRRPPDLSFCLGGDRCV